jgi:archaellum component FlaF (FlaF/FlaG flagellin family)
MGFSNIFAAALAFSVLLGIFYVLYDSLPSEVVELDSELAEKYEDLSMKAGTDFAIENVTHFADSDLTKMALSNNGRLTMDPNMLSFILDGLYLDETSVNISRSIAEGEVNPELWDPGEVLVCNLTYSLEPGVHTFKAFYENGMWCTASVLILDSNMSWQVVYGDTVEGYLDSSADVIDVGATNDSDYLYLRLNLSGSVSTACTYCWYIDIDSNRSTGMPTSGARTLIQYPSGNTKTYGSGAGIEFLASYRDGTMKLYSQGDLGYMLEESKELDVSHPSNRSIFTRIPLSELGFGDLEYPALDFYVYTLDPTRNTDFAPDP